MYNTETCRAKQRMMLVSIVLVLFIFNRTMTSDWGNKAVVLVFHIPNNSKTDLSAANLKILPWSECNCMDTRNRQNIFLTMTSATFIVSRLGLAYSVAQLENKSMTIRMYLFAVSVSGNGRQQQSRQDCPRCTCVTKHFFFSSDKPEAKFLHFGTILWHHSYCLPVKIFLGLSPGSYSFENVLLGCHLASTVQTPGIIFFEMNSCLLLSVRFP